MIFSEVVFFDRKLKIGKLYLSAIVQDSSVNLEPDNSANMFPSYLLQLCGKYRFAFLTNSTAPTEDILS